MARLARFAWLTLGFNVAVIVWGAYVRATGSGAGCGNHWPLCNGQVVPRAPSVETLIEFSHRLSSGLALIAVVTLVWWTRRALAPGHPGRQAAAVSLVFILTEALVGAGLVLFDLVADNASSARAAVMAVHLLNTFLLLASLTLCAHRLASPAPHHLAFRNSYAPKVIAGWVGLLLVGTTGAISALGDTLFPASSLAAGLAADFSASSHLLLRVRALHPILALVVAAALVTASLRLRRLTSDGRVRLAAAAMGALSLGQISLGFLNMLMLAPVWLQLVHLLVADSLWIAYTILAACLLEDQPAPTTAALSTSPHAHPAVSTR